MNYIDESENGKEAKTIFKKVSFDGETSIVKCKPQTGRTHQIRVHLQYLGFPIANDPIYSNTRVWGEDLGVGGKADLQEVMNNLDQIGKTESASSWFYPDSTGEVLLDEECEICETPMYTDPGPNDLELWLHAYRYSSEEDGWSYMTDFPEWALEQNIGFMKQAIEEADKCGETTTAFSVGALFVNNGEIISRGYSREFPGNTHAEQCALEKYFEKTGKRDIPPGTDLYTTMEPCSYRLSGQLPCVDRILEFKDKFTNVFVGVLEPTTFVEKNVGLEKLEDNGVNYIKIPGFEEEILRIACKGHEKREE